MTDSASKLRQDLRAAGLSSAIIDAAWPAWWSDAAASSTSAQVELRLSLARNLGIAPKALIGEKVDFVWHDRARFKHLKASETSELGALDSFGTSMAGSLIQAARDGPGLVGLSAANLRSILLTESSAVDLPSLITACWALGVPVAHLKIWPLDRKAMHAMVASRDDRHAILLVRETSFLSPMAFTLAHEIGHIALGHVRSDELLVDAEDPGAAVEDDEEERAADRYALEVLLGEPDPDIRLNLDTFNHAMLAEAVKRQGPEMGIDPGALALAVGYRQNAWPVAMAALKLIQTEPAPVSDLVNAVARSQLSFESLGSDNASFVKRILGFDDE
ncbi:MAG: hypothetical protein DI637_01760 [Citromicrobium sp.]|nr:MAG: hypothetical protein DI637_01760 [Citromicrobium sp.]